MSLLAFSGTPLAALAANTTFLLDNAELAPRTKARADDMRAFLANDAFWNRFVSDPDRQAAVRNQWADFFAATPINGLVVDAGHGARLYASTAAMPERRRTTPVPLELLFCLETLAELRMRPDVLERPPPISHSIVIDAETTVENMSLGDILTMATGASIARHVFDPRLIAVGLDPTGDVGVLMLLSAAIETCHMKSDAWSPVVGAAQTLFALPISDAQKLVEQGFKLAAGRSHATRKSKIF